MKKLNYLLLAIASVLLLLIGAWIGRGTIQYGETIVETVDTLYSERVDTFYIYKPIPVIEYETTYQTDTLLVPGKVVNIPITTKLYEEKGLYEASVTGYRAELDFIKVFPKTITEKIYVNRIITRNIERAFQPFASISGNTLGHAGIGGGFFYKKLGIEYQYNIPLKIPEKFEMPQYDNYHSLNLKYKF